MKKSLVIAVFSVAIFLTTLSVHADLSTVSSFGSGPDLGCRLCPPPGPPEPKKPPEVANPVVKQKYVWRFVSYGPQNYGTHGPYSSKEDCDNSRKLVSNADQCFRQFE